MLLTIAIISGFMFLVYTFTVFAGENDGSTNLLTYPAICILSTWALNPILGIIFLVVSGFLIIVSLIGYTVNK